MFDISQAKELNDLSIKDMISIKDALKDYQSLTVDNEIDVKNGKQIKSDLEGITPNFKPE